MSKPPGVSLRNRSLRYFEGFPESLDYGLYFFGPEGVCEKYRPGKRNAFLQKERDVLIYVHGWEAAVCWGGVSSKRKVFVEFIRWIESFFGTYSSRK